jgi:hypothetical protein
MNEPKVFHYELHQHTHLDFLFKYISHLLAKLIENRPQQEIAF